MDPQTRSSRARSIDLPKPETGLAEWTSKIKAMQRQVDADDEVEQKKLEEEIAASRLARMRRSHGVGNGSRVNSLDLSQNLEYSSALKTDSPSSGSPVDRQTDQDDALRKLMGSRGLSSPTRSTQDRRPTSPLASKPEPVSLAAFIGGRASGPRLNKPAAQQDAHDPTQFEQRKVDAPHPVFGRGGVAMPGMAKDAASAKYQASGQFGAILSSRSSTADRYGSGDDKLQAIRASVDSKPSPPQSTSKPVTSPSPATAPTAAPPTTATPAGGSRERGMSVSSQTYRAKSPYSRPASPPITHPKDTDDSNKRLLDTPTDRPRSVGRSPSPGNTILSRGKTPEPPQTQRPEARPPSRGTNLPTESILSRGKTPEPPHRLDARPPSRGAELLGGSSTRSITPRRSVQDLKGAPPVVAKKPESMSLAAFMGGRATGPRLNRPAAQQDAHDPTQFEQRRNVTSPHPVFGRGGVAMPGMAAKEASTAKYQGSGQFGGTGDISQGDHTDFDSGRRPASRSSIPDLRSKTPTNTSTPSANSSSSLQRSSPVTTPSLARPIQPVPRQSPDAPQMSASKNPSRAFLRPPPEKEPTPSLTRLKGRGFVQNMIKTSSDLESGASEFGVSVDKPRITSPRKSSVLDRWQPAMSTGSTPASPPVSPKPIPIRKSHTIDPAMSSSGNTLAQPSPPPATNITQSLKTVHSLPSMSQVEPPRPTSRPSSRASKKNEIPPGMPPQDTPGLGSSSTLISYVKPHKTGEDPHPPPASTTTNGGTSAGGAAGAKKASPSEQSVSSGQPLNHPTKGRARKPQKHRDVKQVTFQDPAGASLKTASDETLPLPKVPSPSLIAPPSPLARPITPPDTRLPVKTDPPRQQEPVRVVDRWADQPIIGVKPASSSKPPTEPSTGPSTEISKPNSTSLLSRRALPGLTTPTPQPLPDVFKQEDRPDRSPTTPLSPGRHARIPSTGNRATVMDVAQSWSEHHARGPSETADVRLSDNEDTSSDDERPEDLEKLAEAMPRPRATSPPSNQSEKRRSNYEKYSAIILPSLPEEKTPAPSPAVTLSKASTQTNDKLNGADEFQLQEGLGAAGNAIPETKPVDTPLPAVDTHALLATKPPRFSPNPDTITISIDLMNIQKTSANSITKDSDIFYDTEVLAVIHRSKSKSSGLVSTKVWSWQGKRSQLGDKEAVKLQEIAKRYGTSLEVVHQYREPPELLHLFNGQLVIRQGIRSHWSSENTAMHSVRCSNGLIFIEEHDLSIKNLCSGYSYCLTILDTLYIWHGRGSTGRERSAAMKYAQGLASQGSNIVELIQGETDEDEMFWMMVGDDDFANADYWRWRQNHQSPDPRIWRCDASKGKNGVESVTSFSHETSLADGVYIVDAIWEFFVLVGPKAREQRQNIRLAMTIAEKMSTLIAPDRPFKPTVHIIILPSQIPLDLRMHFRDLDESQINDEKIPDHMNIIPLSDALTHF